jgi:predicted DNA-binding transcriptional regulator AlpA
MERLVPKLLTVPEVAKILRTTAKAIYTMVERRLLPGVVRLRGRLFVDQAVLVDWIDEGRAPSAEGGSGR